MKRIIVDAFPEYKLAIYFREKPEVISSADHIVISGMGQPESPVAVVVAKWRQLCTGRYLHVEMNLLTVEARRRGMLIPLWRVLLNELLASPEGFPELMALKTYNPVVFGTLRTIARVAGAALYPAVTEGVATLEPEVVTRVAESLSPSADFDVQTGVLKQVGVPSDFYPSLPITNKKDIYDYFATHLIPGDRILCVLRFGAAADPGKILRRFGLPGSPLALVTSESRT